MLLKLIQVKVVFTYKRKPGNHKLFEARQKKLINRYNTQRKEVPSHHLIEFSVDQARGEKHIFKGRVDSQRMRERCKKHLLRVRLDFLFFPCLLPLRKPDSELSK